MYRGLKAAALKKVCSVCLVYSLLRAVRLIELLEIGRLSDVGFMVCVGGGDLR